MRDYALGRPDPSHLNAIKADRANTFHHQEAFVRFRPYASSGSWGGRDPLELAAIGAVCGHSAEQGSIPLSVPDFRPDDRR